MDAATVVLNDPLAMVVIVGRVDLPTATHFAANRAKRYALLATA